VGHSNIYNTFLGDQPPEAGVKIEYNVLTMSLPPSLGIDVMSDTAKWLFLPEEYATGGTQCPVPVQTTGKIAGEVGQSVVSCLSTNYWENWTQ
jgi:hypothetical protein